MKLLEFVEKYNNMANNTLREQLLSKIKITPYVSFIKKEVYAQLIVDKTTFEQEAYDDLLRITPKVGAIVMTPDGKGTVEEVNLLTGILKVRLDKFADTLPRSFHRKKVKVIKDAHIRVERAELEELKNLEDH